MCYCLFITLFGFFRQLHSFPCYHADAGPADTVLECDPSPDQILCYQTDSKQQKQNLVIMDLDHTIIDSQLGYHGPLYWKHARYGNVNAFHEYGAVILFLSQPREYSIIFRREFFDFLDYVHKDIGFSADLIIYHNALYQHYNKTRNLYTMSIVNAINKYYNEHYQKRIHIAHQSLFKAVISSTNPKTAKTIRTLAHVKNLDLTKYANIFILDNEADAVWCKHDLIELRRRYKVNVALIEVQPFEIWTDIFRRFRSISSLYKADNRTKVFYALIREYLKKDELFSHFIAFLDIFVKDDAVENLNNFAVLIPNKNVNILRKHQINNMEEP